eukprot:2426659-Alexandrium_andersonii.AAC.1
MCIRDRHCLLVVPTFLGATQRAHASVCRARSRVCGVRSSACARVCMRAPGSKRLPQDVLVHFDSAVALA